MNTDYDIASNIRIIELLKAQLIGQVAGLYQDMQKRPPDVSQRADSIADMIITCRILAQKLGVSADMLDSRVIARLRLALSQDDSMYSELSALIKHLNG